LESGHTKRSTSKKAQHGAKRHSPNIPLRRLETLKNILVEKLVPILRREERRGNIPRVMTLQSSRNPNHPPSMERLRRGKKQKFGYLS
jgi:hypothetical protein